MSTLAEIESAAKQLDPAEQLELFFRLAEELGRTDNLPEPRTFSDEEVQAWLKADADEGRQLRSELGLRR